MIVNYVLSKFPGVTDIANVDPFAGLIRPKVNEVTVTKTLAGIGPLTISQDARLVSTRTIMIRYTKNPSPTDTVYVKRMFSHPAAAEEDAEADRIMVAMGGIPQCVLSIPPRDDSPKSVFVMKESPNCLYLQAPFMRTCMLIDKERNLMNGIIPLPPDVCGELPKEAVVFDDLGQSVTFTVDYYVLVPHAHILAWCLCVSDHWRRMRGIFALEMDVTPQDGKPPFILYFAVANQSFERLKEACCRNFLDGKVDQRPLNTIGLETTGHAEISATFSYMEYPMDVEVARIAPVLDEYFIPYTQVLQAEVEEMRARQAEAELVEKRKAE